MSEESVRDNSAIDRQKGAITRLERLLQRAQTDPDIPLSDQTVMNELIDARRDLLGETWERITATHDLPLLRSEVEGVKSWIKRATFILGGIIAFASGVVTPILVALIIGKK